LNELPFYLNNISKRNTAISQNLKASPPNQRNSRDILTFWMKGTTYKNKTSTNQLT